MIKVLPGGKPLSSQTPVFEFDLNKEMADFFVYKNGMKADSRPAWEVQVQKRMYEYGLSKVLDQASNLFRKEFAGSQAYDSMYTGRGELVTSLVDVPPTDSVLIACIGLFQKPVHQGAAGYGNSAT